jgi:hypothetical protein
MIRRVFLKEDHPRFLSVFMIMLKPVPPLVSHHKMQIALLRRVHQYAAPDVWYA